MRETLIRVFPIVAMAVMVVAPFQPVEAQIPVNLELIPAVQQEIDRIVAVLSVDGMTEESVVGIVADYKGFQGRSTDELLLQVLLTYGGREEHRTDPRAEKAKRTLLGFFLRDMTNYSIVASIGPALEYAQEPLVKSNLYHALDMAAFRDGATYPEFAAFVSYLESRKTDPPRRLVQYMFRQDPEKTLVETEKLYNSDNKVPREIHDSLQGISAVVSGGHWWEELYASEKMWRDPRLRDPALIDQLAKSQYAIVRESVVTLQEKIAEQLPK